MKTTTLSLTGTTATQARNRDNSHEETTIHLTGEGGVTGVLSLRQPVVRHESDTQTAKAGEVDQDRTGLEAGKYSLSLSLSERTEDTKAARQPTTARRASDRAVPVDRATE